MIADLYLPLGAKQVHLEWLQQNGDQALAWHVAPTADLLLLLAAPHRGEIGSAAHRRFVHMLAICVEREMVYQPSHKPVFDKLVAYGTTEGSSLLSSDRLRPPGASAIVESRDLARHALRVSVDLAIDNTVNDITDVAIYPACALAISVDLPDIDRAIELHLQRMASEIRAHYPSGMQLT
jgi:hypothetical protein